MGSLPSELSLDFRPTFVPKTITDFFKEVSMIGNVSDRVSKLNDFIKSLEDEMRKIDAFKRELPLCMILLQDAILAVKDEKMQCAVLKTKPVLEEFIPLKKEQEEDDDDDSKKGNDCRDQKNWMSSVQLWNSDDNHHSNYKLETKRNEKGGPVVTQVSLQSCRTKNGERMHVPFKPSYPMFPSAMVVTKEDKEEFPIHGLSLCTPGIKNPMEESASTGSRSSGTRAVSSSTLTASVNLRTGMQQQKQQCSRKQRRCWSKELHRRFVSALQQLGGSQVATPKQIRELMQVDGLTNDEVKSHLQKFRLHARRLPASAVPPANQSSVVVLGGLLVPQDAYADSSKACSSQSGSPQGPLQLAGTGGDSMEEEDDVKSESYCWKSRIQKPGNEDV
ncbi:myb family transcription factor EFM-like [Cucumis melo var. makuwa]|uniref:Myb family transcription factor EFM-like n=2 Tax=Cucumis melo TaxID=3656 RepID=A0A5A7TXP1_CUCMM|nr:transcription factor HHO6-like [Cucumis melo]KAA0046009.1 myb family transcription factor EFM-like [Cucumis melo var. makuwa]